MFGLCHGRGAFVRLFAFALCLGVSSAALAQEANDDVYSDDMEDAPPAPSPLSAISLEDEATVVRRRVPAEDEETGLRLGSFTASPELEIATVATSNAGREFGNVVSLALRPSLNLQSDWSRHSLRVDASADLVKYLDEGQLDSEGVAVSAATRIDVRRSTQVEFEAGYSLTASAPSEIESAGSPVEGQNTHRLNAGLGITHDFGAVTTKLRASAFHQSYEDVRLADGTTERNGDRDFVEGNISLRASLNTAAHVRPFAEVGYVPRVHDRKRDRNGLLRDSHGVTGAIGVMFDDDPIWSGEIALRSVLRDYADAALNNQSAIGMAANLQWQPRDSTTLAFASSVEIADTISAARGGARNWNFSTDVTQAVRHNVDLTLGASVTFSDVAGGTDIDYGWSAGLDWAINPMVTARVGYEGSWLDAAAAGDDAGEHRALASIVLAP